MSDRVGILILNLGGPEKQEDVYQFLYNLFSDPDLIRIPLRFLQKPIASLIAASRSPITQENYRLIGGGSPLRSITEQQGNALTADLQKRGIESQVYVGMRYWHPYTEDALEQIKRDRISKLVILPLYPQFSISTSGSSLKQIEEIWAKDAELQAIDKVVVESWYDLPGYIDAMAETIATKLRDCPNSETAHIFFSAHGVPKKYVTNYGDPYQVEMENCVDLIMQCLRQKYNCYNAHLLAYQSRVGPVEWLRPYTEDALAQLAKRGINDVLMVPISFISEHIETLQEIDMEYREVAESVGIEHFDRVPALNCHPTFISALSDLVLERLGEKERVVVTA